MAIESQEPVRPEGHAQERAADARDWSRRVTGFADGLRRGGAGLPDLAAEARSLAIGALEDLLAHHLGAHYGGLSFLPLPRPRCGVQAAWEVLASCRALGRAPGVPGPGESSLAVAGRLLESLWRLEDDEGRLELWRARLEHAGRGARAGARAFRARLTRCTREVGDEADGLALLLGLVGSLLDLGDLVAARAALRGSARALRTPSSGELSRLRCWTNLLGGELVEARRQAAEVPNSGGLLPAALVELAGRWAPAAEVLDIDGEPARRVTCGPAWEACPGSALGLGRSDFGASALAVFALGRRRRVEPVHLDVVPDSRPALAAWLAGRARARSSADHPEHALLLSARAQLRHGDRLASALKPESVALALLPVRDEEGEVAGWVHLELEHHLLPPAARLEALAEGWRVKVLRRTPEPVLEVAGASGRVCEGDGLDAPWRPREGRARGLPELEEPARGICAGVFRGLVDELGLRLGRRRWWGIVLAGGAPALVASGGEGLPGGRDNPGGGRALHRCLASTGVVRFEERDPRLSLHAGSASGLTLPFTLDGELVGFLALESERRRDFGDADATRAVELAGRHALDLSLACFRAWHVEHHGHDLYFDGADVGFADFAEQVGAAARSPGPVLLSGPPGSGKRVVARWIHWIATGGRGRLEEWSCAAEPPATARLEARLAPGAEPLLLRDVDRLPAEHQAVLVERLGAQERAGAPLLLATRSEAGVEAPACRATELAAWFERFPLRLPPLAERRRDVPGLARSFASRFAAPGRGSGEDESLRTPTFDDGAMALLWRQPWPGNLRELEALVFKLVHLHPGVEIDVERLSSMARRLRLDWIERLPPRRPRRADVVQSLRTTLLHNGRFNKRRAALYLGWDPDTLAARVRELGLDEASLVREPGGWSG